MVGILYLLDLVSVIGKHSLFGKAFSEMVIEKEICWLQDKEKIQSIIQ